MPPAVRTATPICWSVVWAVQGSVRAPARAQPDRVGLQHVRALRGRVLHEEGRRNGVLRTNRKYWDGDVTDLWAHHLVGHCEGAPVACARLFTLGTSPSTVEGAISTARFEALQQELGVARHRMGETGRWIVAPEHPGARINMALGVCALARFLGLEVLVGMISTRDLQDRRWIHLGARAIEDDLLLESPLREGDHILPVQWDLRRLPATVEAGVEDMARTLGLTVELEQLEPPPAFLSASRSRLLG